MKTNNIKKYCMLFVLTMALVISISTVPPFTAFADEITDATAAEIAAALPTDETENPDSSDLQNNETQTDAEDPGAAKATPEDDTLELGTDATAPPTESDSEDLETQESVVEEAAPIDEAAIPEAPIIRYNAIYLGGLNILGSNWDHIEATVTNAKTGEAQEGFLDYRNSSALTGYLTSGLHSDRNNHYKIEARVYMPNGEIMIINGSSTGTAGSDVEYFTISFKAEGDINIVTPERTAGSEVEIQDPLIPLILLESASAPGAKANPPTSDISPLVLATCLFVFAAFVITLTVCLVKRKALRAGAYPAARTKGNQ